MTKTIHFTLNTDARMPLLNSYENIYDDSTHQNEKKLREGFMTPAQCILSGGFDFKGGNLGSLNIGISSAKFIYIYNQAVYTDMNTDLYYGVKKNKKILFEYGLSTELIFIKEFGNSIKWNCNIKAFKNFNMPIDLNIRNEFSIILGKHIKSSIQTLIEYEKLINKALQLENIVTIGFYFGQE
ncbi:MAG: hypothetical protein NT175_10260 [Bacteroidetes bacterium]|nr:hypothetical protein [Bacteroidota bacterium]